MDIKRSSETFQTTFGDKRIYWVLIIRLICHSRNGVYAEARRIIAWSSLSGVLGRLSAVWMFLLSHLWNALLC